jgi:hypothetical protein
MPRDRLSSRRALDRNGAVVTARREERRVGLRLETSGRTPLVEGEPCFDSLPLGFTGETLGEAVEVANAWEFQSGAARCLAIRRWTTVL